jgi:orotidine 5'-phosphate decarboxylase subfamily 2
MGFFDLLRSASHARDTLLCVGLDPDPTRIDGGADGAFKHCKKVVEQTADLVCCYKPNAAFWEQYGPAGWDALARLRQEIPNDTPVLFDAKRADVGHTMAAYAQAVFGAMDMSAATVHGYHGVETIEQFAAWQDRGVYVVALSSNAGGADLQQALVDGRPVYQHVASLAQDANGFGNVGVVAGATQPEHARQLREAFPELPFLMPGLGGQGASIPAAVAAAYTGDPVSCLLSASRSVLYAADPRSAAEKLRHQINCARPWFSHRWRTADFTADGQQNSPVMAIGSPRP